MKILAIDTSCDETSAAVLENEKVLCNAVTSQISFHKKWGGVNPSVAREKHLFYIDSVVKRAMKVAQCDFKDIDYIAVTNGPGLAIALEVGISKAKELSKKYSIPVVTVNHLEGHIYSVFLKNKLSKPFCPKPKYPFLALLISGGHTQLILVKEFGEYECLGQSVDDAAGEAFDKVARLLKLGYPGGPIIEELAKKGNKNKYEFPRPLSNKDNFNLSFSGLKTAALVKLKNIFLEKNDKKGSEISFSPHSSYYDIEKLSLSKKELYDFSASFQQAVIDSIKIKLKKAIKTYNIKHLCLSGGVVSNLALRREYRAVMKNFGGITSIPHKKFCTDNASMIGISGYYNILHKKNIYSPNEVDKIDRKPSLNLCN